MFNDSIRFVAQSIEKSPLIEKNNIVYQKYQNFLDEKILNRVESKIDMLKTVQLERQIKLPRQRADYNQELMRELKIIFSHSTIRKALEKKYNIKLRVRSIDIWFDYKDYVLNSHVDDESIKLSLQIYLTNDQHPGTVLYQSKQDTEYFDIFPYQFNCGYSMLNTKNSYHGLEYTVKTGIRKSLYVRFK